VNLNSKIRQSIAAFFEKEEVDGGPSVERLHRALQSTFSGICETDAEGRLTFINQAAKKLLGIADVSDVCIYDVLKPYDSESNAVFRDHFLRPDVAVECKRAQVRHPDGTLRTMEWSTSPMFRDEATASRIFTFCDITARVAEERFTQFQHELLQLIALNKSTEEVLRVLATAVELRLAPVRCSVLVSEGNAFRVAATPSMPDALRSTINGLSSDTPVPCSNPLDKEKAWRKVLRDLSEPFGFQSTWTEVIVSPANEVLGTVLLNREDSVPLSVEQRNILKEAARLAALAIEHRNSFDRLLHQGHHDPLTGLPNRLLLQDRLKQALARAERKHSQLALLCIDLDRFKNVNDTFGHEAGDLFLQQMSVRFMSRIRASDTLARTGGDEFTAIIGEINGIKDAEKVAQALLDSLREPFDIFGHSLYGGASIGIALYPQDGKDAISLHRSADRAMYRAKAQGGNVAQSSCRDEGPGDKDRLELEAHLHKAIEQGNFSLYFQPQYTCNRQISGFEALLRFKHPKLGTVPPSRFIPIAEESGLILPIGEWVLQTTCQQIAEWLRNGISPTRVAVNVSPLQFMQPDFTDTVAKAVHDANIRPELLELELTEGILMQNLKESARQMRMLAEFGVKFALDDFGTGYSSLSYLHQLPIHLLKIDQSFIKNMLDPAGTGPIVDGIISLAHGLGLKTVAEGVELEEQLIKLHDSGCDLVQGFYLSHPVTAVEASCLLGEQHKRMSQDRVLRPQLITKRRDRFSKG
jgi:diguanylate cyclase (GGDEF)-like protein/PAS domain S-box-containing protein